MAMTLRAARVNAGFKSAETAAEALGFSTNIVRNWERGITVPDVIQLKRILEVYDVSYNDLIFLPSNRA